MGELVDIAAEGNPQGPPAIMELMEEDKSKEEELMTTPTIVPMGEDELGQEKLEAGRTMEFIEEVLGKLGHEASTAPQESSSTLGPNTKETCHFSFFSLIPKGSRVCHSPRRIEEDIIVHPALNLS